jgi:hypothetical protein
MSREGLDALRARVFGDPALASALRDAEPANFAAEVLRLASELGCDVSEDDVRSATARAKERWRLRWIL